MSSVTRFTQEGRRCEHIDRLHTYLNSYKLEILTQEPDEEGQLHNPVPLTILCHKCGGRESDAMSTATSDSHLRRKIGSIIHESD